MMHVCCSYVNILRINLQGIHMVIDRRYMAVVLQAVQRHHMNAPSKAAVGLAPGSTPVSIEAALVPSLSRTLQRASFL